jgi:RimJ/RimL family protein N-acetyltransferase
LGKDQVARWFGKGQDERQLGRKYLEYARGGRPTRPHIIRCAGEDIGYIQVYRIDDYPGYKKALITDDNACGIDMFIGDERFMHKGIGPKALRKYLNEVAFSLTDTEVAIVSPSPENGTAIRAYAKVGFEYVRTIIYEG